MQLFYELLQIAIGTKAGLNRKPADNDWWEAYQMASKQSLVGLLFSAVEKINAQDASLKPPIDLFYQWYGEVAEIEQRNKELNISAHQLYNLFKKDGYRSCVLKGQGVAQLYPNPERRQPGDIDLWVEGKRDDTVRYLRECGYEMGDVVIHHVDTKILDGVDTEIHFIPGYSYNPFLHYKMQKFFRKFASEQFGNYDEKVGFAHPTLRFNAVYILSHIYMHFLYEGIGLRQVIDYYYVLGNMNDEERKQVRRDISNVGLEKFAGAVMYVLAETCAIPEAMMIAAPKNRHGELLLREIFMGGNFGKYDERLCNRNADNLISYGFASFKRQITLIKDYPMEIICVPFWKCTHWLWRKYKGYLKK